MVGDASFGEVCDALRAAEGQLGLQVNPTVYPPTEFDQKMNDRHYFIKRVPEDPVIFLIGGRDELSGQGELPQGGRADGPPAAGERH